MAQRMNLRGQRRSELAVSRGTVQTSAVAHLVRAAIVGQQCRVVFTLRKVG
jgi:hypothetical protein